MKKVSLIGIILSILMVLMFAIPVLAYSETPEYVPSAGSAGGWSMTCSECGAVLQCAWLSSQFKQPGFYGWDYSVPGGKMWGVCKCGNGK